MSQLTKTESIKDNIELPQNVRKGQFIKATYINQMDLIQINHKNFCIIIHYYRINLF